MDKKMLMEFGLKALQEQIPTIPKRRPRVGTADVKNNYTPTAMDVENIYRPRMIGISGERPDEFMAKRLGIPNPPIPKRRPTNISEQIPPIPKRRPTAMDLEGPPTTTQAPGMKYEPSVRRSMTEPAGGDSVSKYNYARDPRHGTPKASMAYRLKNGFTN